MESCKLHFVVTVFFFRKGEAMKTVRTAICVLGFVAALAMTQNVYGTVILNHSGATDPATESGWARSVRNNYSGVSEEAVINDQDSGTNAWRVTDTHAASSSGDFLNYDGASALTASALAEIGTGGWALRANLRVDDLAANGFDQTLALAPGMQVALAGVQQWAILKLGQDGSGNTIAQVSAGYNPSTGSLNESSIITISGSGYHNYELRSGPTGSLLDLYVDGMKRIDGLSNANLDAGLAAALGNVIQWGTADSPGIGAGYFNSVQFETAPAPVPEPSTSILLSCGIIGMLAYAWRKRR